MLGRKPARAPLSGADLADGIVTADKVAPDVATQAELDAKVPSQSGHSGKYLTTDATNSSWASVDALPSQSGHSGKYLTTDATNSSWATVSAASSITHNSGTTFTDGDIYVSPTNIAYYYSPTVTRANGAGWIALGPLQGNPATSIAGGENHFLFLMANGTVKSVGDNGSGQLGDGTTTSRLTAVAVSGIAGYTTNASDLA
jgi:hypothetical protein